MFGFCKIKRSIFFSLMPREMALLKWTVAFSARSRYLVGGCKIVVTGRVQRVRRHGLFESLHRELVPARFLKIRPRRFKAGTWAGARANILSQISSGFPTALLLVPTRFGHQVVGREGLVPAIGQADVCGNNAAFEIGPSLLSIHAHLHAAVMRRVSGRRTGTSWRMSRALSSRRRASGRDQASPSFPENAPRTAARSPDPVRSRRIAGSSQSGTP